MLLYGAPGKRLNDSWYANDGGTYHAYFMQRTRRGARPDMGHAVSKDFLHWTYEGRALDNTKVPWCRKCTGTGSVIRWNGKWWMIFGGSSEWPLEHYHLGIASSDDLCNWDVDPEPVMTLSTDTVKWDGTTFDFPLDGKTAQVYPLGDPCFYPEQVDGYWLLFVNSHLKGAPVNKRGVTALFRTKDLKTYEPYRIAAMDSCDRMETVCPWEHDGRYYMYVGRIISKTDGQGNVIGQYNYSTIYTATEVAGPYTMVQRIMLPREDLYWESWPYIAKVVKDPEGRDVMLVNDIPGGVTGPYPVVYLDGGAIALDERSVPQCVQSLPE